jgi:diacylglycerol kinase family enzyme
MVEKEILIETGRKGNMLMHNIQALGIDADNIYEARANRKTNPPAIGLCRYPLDRSISRVMPEGIH